MVDGEGQIPDRQLAGRRRLLDLTAVGGGDDDEGRADADGGRLGHEAGVVDPRVADEGAVGRAQIGDEHAVVIPLDAGVVGGDERIGQNEVVVRRPADHAGAGYLDHARRGGSEGTGCSGAAGTEHGTGHVAGAGRGRGAGHGRTGAVTEHGAGAGHGDTGRGHGAGRADGRSGNGRGEGTGCGAGHGRTGAGTEHGAGTGHGRDAGGGRGGGTEGHDQERPVLVYQPDAAGPGQDRRGLRVAVDEHAAALGALGAPSVGRGAHDQMMARDPRMRDDDVAGLGPADREGGGEGLRCGGRVSGGLGDDDGVMTRGGKALIHAMRIRCEGPCPRGRTPTSSVCGSGPGVSARTSQS